jgi:hypothetical protein
MTGASSDKGKAGWPRALGHELEAFRRELPRLIAEGHQGKYALIHEAAVAGIYDSVDEALNAGYSQFELMPFLVRQVTDHEEPRFFSRKVSR